MDVQIDENDLRIDVYRASGAGGQHVNKTDSAVRITHIPTGIVVAMQEERSQHKNRAKAMKILRARMYEQQRSSLAATRAADRKSQVGTGDRSERIRTYNFPQGRVSDHRINLTLYKIDRVMQGDLDEFIDALTRGGSGSAAGGGGVSRSTVAEAIRDGAVRLEGIADNPRLEARLLLAHALGVTQNDLIRDPARPVETERFEVLVGRRVAREPLALIVGRREFWSLDFLVSPATLIPRADSETVVEAALAAFAGRAAPRWVLDLGSGTGCLLLALLSEFPSAFGIGVDLAPGGGEAGQDRTRSGLAWQIAPLSWPATGPIRSVDDST